MYYKITKIIDKEIIDLTAQLDLLRQAQHKPLDELNPLSTDNRVRSAAAEADRETQTI
jgi:hypothetical protein